MVFGGKCHVYSDGLAAVKKNKLWGYIDEVGNMVIGPMYEDAKSFVDGKAEVFVPNKGWYIIGKDNQWIYYPDYRLTKAESYLAAGDYEAAAKEFESLAKDDKTIAAKAQDAWYKYAEELQKDGKYAESIEISREVDRYCFPCDRIHQELLCIPCGK